VAGISALGAAQELHAGRPRTRLNLPPHASRPGLDDAPPQFDELSRPSPLAAVTGRGWQSGWRAVPAGRATPAYRLPAEFERQRALMISCHEFIDDMPELLSDIIRQLQGRIEIIALVNDVVEYQRARDSLVQHGCTLASVRFVEVPHDTMWCRDYGPILVEGPRGFVAAVDTEYVRGVRPQDDDVPVHLCRQLHLPLRLTSLRIEGGNLLSNGQGLCITTQHVLQNNADQSDEKAVRRELRRCFGASQIVFLEPLEGEPTGHVDMFATFTSPTTVVVGKYHPDVDPVNAETLDHNAEQLARVRTAEGPLQVIRVPMPRRNETAWRTYTNVVYANGVVLVPVYRDLDNRAEQFTLRMYGKLLPGWQIVTIDADRLAELGGAMHCITMNLGPLKQIPPLRPPQRILDDRQTVASVGSLPEE
jgi:agmatine/peptidylarginine deiminase